ncbi:MATE family efflux transporter [Sphingomonas sp. ID1715]|uniref:MATE family efflux transporter n=1 Tax=Sphingomonas sp. ID1715 TaxID=1656898 RepID=UPI001488FA20|nr:MATE family efflux transporter [Sphingomonas sp. ID1715]NNM77960.1 MATE family efflux transporter [Sphingomonas sp. ID1715]
MARDNAPPRQDLTEGPIASTLLKFALPTLGSSVLQSLNGSINTFWVGHFLGEEALAATSNANMIMFLLNAFVFGFGMAATVLIGQSYGRRDIDAVRRTIGTAMGAFIPLTLVVALLGWVFAPQILDLLQTPAGAWQLALDYLRVIFIAIPLSLIVVLLMMGLRGVGDSVTPFYFMFVAVVLDSGLNPVFILGLGPAPTLGIAGSALATVIANLVGLLAMIGFIYARDLPLRLRGAELGYLRPQGALLRTIAAKGFPMGLQMIVISLAALVMIGFVNAEGVDTAAAFGVAQQLWTYVQMPAMAIGAAVSAMAAQNIGAGRWDRVSQIMRAGVAQNVLLTGALVLLLLAADRPAIALFLGQDSPAMGIARHIQLLATWNFVLFGVTMVFFGIVRANGAVFAPLVILFVAMFPVRLGFIALARPALGADALWLSFPAGSIVTLVLAGLYYRYGGWRKARMMTPPSGDECREEALGTSEPAGRLNPAA